LDSIITCIIFAPAKNINGYGTIDYLLYLLALHI